MTWTLFWTWAWMQNLVLGQPLDLLVSWHKYPSDIQVSVSGIPSAFQIEIAEQMCLRSEF